nr:hypothetical protein [Tanacetum cinerariifolium]
RLRSLETTFSEYRQTNPFVDVVSTILGIVHPYMTQQMTEAIQEAVQIQTDRLQDSLQRENDEFLHNIDENMKKIIKGQVKSQRRREDDDQEGPSAGSDRGSKRQREGASESAFAEEPVQTTCQMEEPPHPPRRPPSPDRDWNKTLPATQGDAQSWISDLARQTDARSSFNELLDTPIDFSNFIMNRLGVATLTPKLLAGPTYELMRGSCNSLTELEYYLEEVYKATTDQLDWVNPKRSTEPINYDRHALWGVSHWGRKRQQFYGFAVNRESALDVYSKRRIIAVIELKIMEWHDYKHLDWISADLPQGLNLDNCFPVSLILERNLCRLPVRWRNPHIRCLKQPLPLIPNNRGRRVIPFDHFINNDLEYLRGGMPFGEFPTGGGNVSSSMGSQLTENLLSMYTPRGGLSLSPSSRLWNGTTISIWIGFRYVAMMTRFTNLKKAISKGYASKTLKICCYSWTLNDVRNTLDDRLKGIRMQYLPTTIWRSGDKDRAAAMIQAIDKMLKTRRILRSLEKFVGGRLYEGDFRMLQRTI